MRRHERKIWWRCCAGGGKGNGNRGRRRKREAVKGINSGNCTWRSEAPNVVMSWPRLCLASALVVTARSMVGYPVRKTDLVPGLAQMGLINSRLETGSPGSVGHFATPP